MNKYTKLEGKAKQASKSEYNAKLLKDLEVRYGEEFRGTLDNVFSSLGRSGDDSIISAGYANFMEAVTGGQLETMDDVEEFAGVIEGINWGNPIEAASQLNETIATGSDLAKNFATSIKESGQSFLGLGSQMRFFTTTEEFAEVKDELSEILETQDGINAKNVLELAESYKSLD
jgi:hypothetical protein